MAWDENTARFPVPAGDLLTVISAMNSQIFDFTAARFKEDMQTRHDLLQAKGVAEVQQIQTRFVQKAMDDNAAQAARLMEMTGSAVLTGAAKARV
jgi:hypothetical protein